MNPNKRILTYHFLIYFCQELSHDFLRQFLSEENTIEFGEMSNQLQSFKENKLAKI